MLVPSAWPTSFLPQEFVEILTSCGFGSIATLAQVDEEPEAFVQLLSELLDEKIIFLTDSTEEGTKDLLATLKDHKRLLLAQKVRFIQSFLRVRKSQVPLCDLAAKASVHWANPRPHTSPRRLSSSTSVSRQRGPLGLSRQLPAEQAEL